MLDKILKRIVSSPLLIYIIRCFIGFLTGYKLYIEFPDFELFWTLLSIILVISPEEKDTRRLSTERFKSNFIGSAIAMGLLLFFDPNVYSIVAGILITIVICRLFNVMNMARVALVALLIIMVQPHQAALVEAPIYRFGSVAIGCIIGWLIVLLTSMVFRPLKRKFGIHY